jgi:hypothetical protein
MSERRQNWVSANLKAVIIAGFVAIAPTVLAVATLVTSINNGRKTNELHIQGIEIHQLVNSNLTRVKADLELALTRIIKLEKLISEMKTREKDIGMEGK